MSSTTLNRLGAALGALLVLAACEAPLRLEAVKQRMEQAVHRSDQFQAAAANDGTLVVVGNQGLVLTSSDEGRNWRRLELPDWPALIGLTSCPDGTFAALGAEGVVWISRNDGSDWTPRALDTQEAPQDITCDPLNRLWVVGSFASIFSSADRGESWDYTSLDEDLFLTNIQFLDADNAYISGEFGTVLKSQDGGATWERLPELVNSFYPQDMYFADPLRGWVVGLQGQILFTDDGGQTWELEPTPTRASIFGIAPAGGKVYAVGGEGSVLQRDEYEWVGVDHGKPILLYLRPAHAVGDDRLLVGGKAGALYVLPLDGAGGASEAGGR